MKVVILAGGLGTRIMEETKVKPKPMVEIGGKPILWHIMKYYSYHGLTDFIICCGYKGYKIKEYFANYYLHMSDVTFDMQNNSMNINRARAEPWNVTLVDTGEETMTGGRIKRIRPLLGDDDFCMTYGDGLTNLNLNNLIKFHNSHDCLATFTAVYPPARFGSFSQEGHYVTDFIEKPKGDGAKINGGFFVLSPKVIDYIDGDGTSWEEDPIRNLARDRKLSAYHHEGFWYAMDSLKDKAHLEALWASGRPPWKVW